MLKEATKRPYDSLLCDNRATTPANEQFIGNAFTATEQDPTYFLIPHRWKTAHLRSKDFRQWVEQWKKTNTFAASFTKSCQSRVIRKVPFIETDLLEIWKNIVTYLESWRQWREKQSKKTFVTRHKKQIGVYLQVL